MISGGQKQRVATARALLKGGELFLLDEPTSALDIDTEISVQKTLDEVSCQSTTLLVTHRLTTVINADIILFMQAGEIVERGTYAELMSNPDGKFYELMTKQCQEYGVNEETIASLSHARPTEISEDLQALKDYRLRKRTSPSNANTFFRPPPTPTAPAQEGERLTNKV